MKAKHAIARIKGLAIWQKIFCALLALTLLSLMIPSGLRANATQADNGEAQESTIETTTEEVTNDGAPILSQEELNDFQLSWPRVESTVDFTKTSLNSDVTAGYFVKQTADFGVQELVEIAIKYAPFYIKDEYGIYDSTIRNEEQLINAIHFLDDTAFTKDGAVGGWLLALLNQMAQSTPMHEDFSADFSKALWVPHIETPFDPGAEPTIIEQFFRVLNYINSLVILDSSGTHKLGETFNGSVLYLCITGSDGGYFDQLLNTKIHAARIMPIIPILNLSDKLTTAFKSNGANEDENVQAFFVGWELSFDGGNSFMPTTWLEKWQQKRIPAAFPIYNDSHYILRGVFYDVEGLVQIHIDFDHAFTQGPLVSALIDDGWWSEEIMDMVPPELFGGAYGGSYWTTVVPEWMPTWMVYSYIYEEYGPYILDNGNPSVNDSNHHPQCCVYKDSKLVQSSIDPANDNERPIFAGPHWVETDNENWFGTIDKETTIKFCWYPVSPCGSINHMNIQDFIPSFDIDSNDGFEVGYADVMYYNQWGMPLFRYDHALYGILDKAKYSNDFPAPNSLMYGFGVPAVHGSNIAEIELDTCFDQEIDHVVIKAQGWTKEIYDEYEIPYTHDYGTTYIPLRVDKDQLDPMKADILFNTYGVMNYDVEALMTAGFTTGFPAGLDNYEISYYEDGELLFDPFTINNFWEMQLFTMPMATGGTLTVEPNGDLVNTFSAYFDYWRPWAADPLNAFSDPNQFDPTPGVTHTFQCRIHSNTEQGKIVHGWNYDLVFHIGLGDVLPLTDFILDRHLISPIIVDSAVVNATGGEGHASFHIDYYVDSYDYFKPTFSYDFPSGFGDIYGGTEYSVQADGTLLAYHYDGGIFHNHSEAGIITAVGLPGYQLTSWTINGVNYPVGTVAEKVATAVPGVPVTIVANYNGSVTPTPVPPEPVNPDVPGGGEGGTAQTSDGMGFAFAILAMIAIAGAGVLAGRKLYNK